MNRRHFLGALGATLLAPQPRRARAQGAPKAKRLVVFFSPNGTIPRLWRPTGSRTNFSFAPGTILEPLAAIKDKLVILDGVDFYGASNHEGGMAAMLTGGGSGVAQGASVDQYLAGQIGAETRFPSLELGVQTSAWGGNVQTRMCYRRSGEYAPPDDDPRAVFRRLFGEASAEPVDRLLLKRRSVLDLVRGELRALSDRVGSLERQKLEVHLDSLRQLETSLAGVPQNGCGGPVLPNLNPSAAEAFPAVGKAQMDLAVAALACDQTRVVSLQWSHTVGPHVFSWLGISEAHHGLSHMDDGNQAGVSDFVAAERWFAEQFAYLVNQMDSLPEPGGEGSLLDNSLVLWAKEMGDSRLHVCESVPFIMAGRAGGYLTPGQYLQFQRMPHTRVLTTVCHAMGVPVDVFGNPTHGMGPLAEVRG